MNTEKYLIELLECKDERLQEKDQQLGYFRGECYELSKIVSHLCNFAVAETDEQKSLLAVKNRLSELSKLQG